MGGTQDLFRSFFKALNRRHKGKFQPDKENLSMDMAEDKHLAIIEREGNGYVLFCPELDIASQGITIEEARINLREALELFFRTASPAEIQTRFHFPT
jgi:predicted RNase H-like HicB family nuclease